MSTKNRPNGSKVIGCFGLTAKHIDHPTTDTRRDNHWLEKGQGSDIIFTVTLTLQALYGRHFQPDDRNIQQAPSQPRLYHQVLPKTLAYWTKCYAGEKKGNLNVEKLWIILLFESNFNNNNKWLGRAAMFNVEKQNQMAPEQYSSCKEKSAVIQCLNKRLLYNYVWYSHIPLAVCSNDAKSCYNRIVLIIAVLSLC